MDSKTKGIIALIFIIIILVIVIVLYGTGTIGETKEEELPATVQEVCERVPDMANSMGVIPMGYGGVWDDKEQECIVSGEHAMNSARWSFEFGCRDDDGTGSCRLDAIAMGYFEG